MNGLIPPFDFQQVFVMPWTAGLSSYGWSTLMGFLVATACGLIGTYLILRRMALVGDAISHSVLPGLAIGFLVANSRGSWVMFLGALGAGIVTTILIELIHKKSRVKQDAAIGITFSSLFAIGVILISLYASKVDLDQECVLYGEIGTVWTDVPVTVLGVTLGPAAVVRMGAVTLVTALLIALFYKELLVSSFDAGLAFSLGINATVVHYSLMSMLSVVVVSAFESVGAILVIAMLILPGATASLLSQRLPVILGLTVVHAAVSAVLGTHLALWLNCSIAAAMVVMGAILFTLAWVFSPSQGLLRRWIWLRAEKTEAAVAQTEEAL
ncbi:MAG: metal ABC transporter permease [Verrucomicrobia subdivision 3 bacterium]|nr:metal ABC transporter permease [Limisphaerales bacterium]